MLFLIMPSLDMAFIRSIYIIVGIVKRINIHSLGLLVFGHFSATVDLQICQNINKSTLNSRYSSPRYKISLGSAIRFVIKGVYSLRGNLTMLGCLEERWTGNLTYISRHFIKHRLKQRKKMMFTKSLYLMSKLFEWFIELKWVKKFNLISVSMIIS